VDAQGSVALGSEQQQVRHQVIGATPMPADDQHDRPLGARTRARTRTSASARGAFEDEVEREREVGRVLVHRVRADVGARASRLLQCFRVDGVEVADEHVDLTVGTVGVMEACVGRHGERRVIDHLGDVGQQ
jgi:hypothetical protein